MESKVLNKMNVKQRAKAKKDAAEEAYYKGMEAPKTTFVDTGNGITEVQTNSDKNEQINAPSATKETKRTTLQNYKPVQSVEQAKPQEIKQEVTEEVAPAETTETKTPAADTTPDIKVDVPEVDEEMMAESGINPQNSEEQNKQGTENALSEITGRRNKDGTYVPLNKVQYADGIQKFGIFATIASIGLAVLTKGAFPPVDFSAMTGLNESYAKYVEGIDNYNKYVRQAQGENSYESERAKGSLEDANKTAQLNLTTENQQKERDTNYQAFLKNLDAQNTQAQTKLEAELNVALQDVLTEGQIDVINANRDVQKEILQLMYTQDVNKLADQGKAIIDAGFSLNDLNKLAQFSKSQSGQTFFENIIKGFNTAANAANVGANIVNAVKGGTSSDCGTKEFFKRMIKF